MLLEIYQKEVCSCNNFVWGKINDYTLLFFFVSAAKKLLLQAWNNHVLLRNLIF